MSCEICWWFWLSTTLEGTNRHLEHLHVILCDLSVHSCFYLTLHNLIVHFPSGICTEIRPTCMQKAKRTGDLYSIFFYYYSCYGPWESFLQCSVLTWKTESSGGNNIWVFLFPFQCDFSLLLWLIDACSLFPNCDIFTQNALFFW